MTISSNKNGFTLIELLIVTALIAVLLGATFMTINPGRQFANSRNATRFAHLSELLSAISSNIAANNGTFTCASGSLPITATNMASAVGNYNIGPCLVPDFLVTIPYDPSATGAQWTSSSNYNSGYTIILTANGHITVTAPSAELSASISLTR